MAFSTGYVVNSGTISGTYQAVTDGFGTIANTGLIVSTGSTAGQSLAIT